MENKIVLITGANSGIGKETAKDLAGKNAKIYMACRNVDSAKKVAEEIVNETGNSNIIVMKIDLSSFESIREFSYEFLNRESCLDVLIHNAGYGGYKREASADGIEMTYAVNHFGPFLLTHLLIGALKRAAPSRIIVVASNVYRYARINLENLNPMDTWRPTWFLYYSSKGLNIMFTLELARRLEGSGVTVNCLHPGYVHTPLWRRLPALFWIPTNFIYKTFGKTPIEGAQCSIYLASSLDVENISGKYFIANKEVPLLNFIADNQKCKILWEESLKIVKVRASDPIIQQLPK